MDAAGGMPTAAEDARPIGASLAWATWALFAGLALLLVGVGLFATIVGVRAVEDGYSSLEQGVLTGAYYGGFLAGSQLTVRALAKVGHIRVYAALAALLAACILAVGLTEGSLMWIVLRAVSGMCIAGLYVVAESWLNQCAGNENRGRLLAVYLLVTGGCFGLGQLLVGAVDTATVSAFAVAAVLTSLAVVPVSLSEDALPPPIERSTTMALKELARIVPTGVGSCLIIGVTHGSLFGMAVIYGTRAGLDPTEVGRFAFAGAVGGLILQWPVSAASDELDRRYVGATTALAASAVAVWLLLSGPQGWQGLAAMALLGGLSSPLYAIAAAYTNDWVEPEQVSGAASQLILLYGTGALVGPPLTSGLLAWLGADGFPWAMAGFHAGLAMFFVYRLFAWRAPLATVTWGEASFASRAFFIPANVVWMGRRLRRRRGAA